MRCDICDTNDTGDEFHYLFKCSYFAASRKLLLGKTTYYNVGLPVVNSIICNNRLCQLKKLSQFVKIIMDKFDHLNRLDNLVVSNVPAASISTRGRHVARPVRLNDYVI